MSCIFFFTCSLLFEAQSRIWLLHFVFRVQLSLIVCSCHQNTSFLNLWPNLTTTSLFFWIHLLLMYIQKKTDGKTNKQRRHHDPTLYICTIDTFITFSFDSLNVVNSTRITVCVNGAARLKRKPRGIWFIYKAIAFMYKKPNPL